MADTNLEGRAEQEGHPTDAEPQTTDLPAKPPLIEEEAAVRGGDSFFDRPGALQPTAPTLATNPLQPQPGITAWGTGGGIRPA